MVFSLFIFTQVAIFYKIILTIGFCRHIRYIVHDNVLDMTDGNIIFYLNGHGIKYLFTIIVINSLRYIYSHYY